jgi:hypothetical protein
VIHWIAESKGDQIPAAVCDLCGAVLELENSAEVLELDPTDVLDLDAAGWVRVPLPGIGNGRDVCPKCWAMRQ